MILQYYSVNRLLGVLMTCIYLLFGLGSHAFALNTTAQLIDVYDSENYAFNAIRGLVEADGQFYFVASNSEFGDELWTSDGTASGTTIVKDLTPGPSSSVIADLYAVGSKVVFVFNDGSTGNEPWVSDGTAAGTHLLADTYSGIGGSTSDYTLIGDTLYFAANGYDGTTFYGTELWRTDGTTANTVMVKDIWPGGGTSAPRQLRAVGSTLFFLAYSPDEGQEIWKSDGAAASTVLVKDQVVGTGSLSFGQSASTDTHYFYTVYDSLTGYELYASDGTPAGTGFVKEISPGTSGINFSASATLGIGTTLFFAANDGTTGSELWKSDGSASGTVLVKDINTGSPGSSATMFVQLGSDLLFQASTVGGPGLWKSDGSSAGTSLVKVGVYSAVGIPPVVSGANAYFFAFVSGFGYELWKSDATTAGTAIVKDITPGTQSTNPTAFMAGSTTQLLFVAGMDSADQTSLWNTDGSASGTNELLDIYDGTKSANVDEIITLGNVAIFVATDAVSGRELWVTNGTAAGTQLLKEFTPGAASSSLSGFHQYGSHVYFLVASRLWKTDGTVTGTVPVTPETGVSLLTTYVVDGDDVYFLGYDSSASVGYELYLYDGTTLTLLKDICTGICSTNIYEMRIVGSDVYFEALDSASNHALYKTDGTPSGTVLVKDIHTGTTSRTVTDAVVLDGKYYFAGLSNVNGSTDRELWVSDGTNAGTVIVKDIYVNGSAFVAKLAQMDGKLYFGATSNTNVGLWVSEGTAATTTEVAVTNVYSDLYPYDGKLYFSGGGGSGTGAAEPWMSDGTSAGTSLIKDLNPSFSYPLDFYGAGERVFFVATNGQSNAEVYKTDGTEIGTEQVSMLSAGFSGLTSDFALVGNHLVFHGYTPYKGTELYSLRVGDYDVSVTAAPTSFSQAGDTVTVTYTVENTGYIAQTNVKVSDALIGGIACTIVSIAPGSTGSCSASYVTTQDDMSAGQLSFGGNAQSDQATVGVPLSLAINWAGIGNLAGIPGTTCRANNKQSQISLSYGTGRVINNHATNDRFVVCTLPRDSQLTTRAIARTAVSVPATRTISCSLKRVNTANGFSVSDTDSISNVTGTSVDALLDMSVTDPGSALRYESVVCSLPPGGAIYGVYFEQTP